MAGKTASAITNGQSLILFGLVVQIVFLGIFTIVALIFDKRFSRALHLSMAASTIKHQKYLNALYISNALIIVRSSVRVAEFVQGKDGYIMQHEWVLYVSDGVLMFGVMVIFNLVHPGELSTTLRDIVSANPSITELRSV